MPLLQLPQHLPLTLLHPRPQQEVSRASLPDSRQPHQLLLPLLLPQRSSLLEPPLSPPALLLLQLLLLLLLHLMQPLLSLLFDLDFSQGLRHHPLLPLPLLQLPPPLSLRLLSSHLRPTLWLTQ